MFLQLNVVCNYARRFAHEYVCVVCNRTGIEYNCNRIGVELYYNRA